MSTPAKVGRSADAFVAALFGHADVNGRARLIADRLNELLPGCAAVVYVAQGSPVAGWLPVAILGDTHVKRTAVPTDTGALGRMLQRGATCLFAGASLTRELYAHLDVRRTVASLACLPLRSGEALAGAIEVVSFDQPMADSVLESFEAVAEYAAPALAAAAQYEEERNNSLHSITRLSQLYDLEKVFNATLEMDALLPIIGSKVRDVLDAGAIHVWMVGGGDELVLMQSTGQDPTIPPGTAQNPGEGIASEVSESGVPVLVAEGDERLARRNASAGESPVTSVMAAPLIVQDKLVGVLEAANQADRRRFSDDDLFFLASIGDTTANALQNASLLQTERKLEILQTLVHVSKEITSTLNMDRVLHAIVNGPSSVIPYERAAIALNQRGRVQIKAISGEAQFNPSDADVKRLDEMLQWAAQTEGELSVTSADGSIEGAPPETASRFRQYFEQSGMHAFHSIPLADDEGRIGTLTLESADPHFLSITHLEMVRVLAGQATVALRNAQLYRDVPFISVLEPLLQKKQRFMALQKRRRLALVGAAVATVVLLTVLPFPMRVEGDATVGPVHRGLVQPQEAGTVRTVYVKEGTYVRRGDVLADMEDWEQRASLADARAKYAQATAEMNRALAVGDSGQAGVQQVQAAYWTAEIERRTRRLENTHLRAPIDGWVTTPHVDTFTGRQLAAGDLFAEVEDNSRATVDVALDEGDLPLASNGEAASVKLDGYPVRTFRGSVAIVSPKGDVRNNEPVFFARVDVPNPDHLLRPGMQGRSKISVGWRPLGYVLFRKPASWLYSHGWSWFGW